MTCSQDDKESFIAETITKISAIMESQARCLSGIQSAIASSLQHKSTSSGQGRQEWVSTAQKAIEKIELVKYMAGQDDSILPGATECSVYIDWKPQLILAHATLELFSSPEDFTFFCDTLNFPGIKLLPGSTRADSWAEVEKRFCAGRERCPEVWAMVGEDGLTIEERIRLDKGFITGQITLQLNAENSDNDAPLATGNEQEDSPDSAEFIGDRSAMTAFTTQG